MKALLVRRRRAARRLPLVEEILRGSIYVRSIRCGKQGCHCATEEGHRTTYLSVTLRGGRTEQISLPAPLVPLAKRWVANYARLWEVVEAVSEINRQILRARRQRRVGSPRDSSAGRTARARRRGG